ncbi:MAG: M1 family aminopeptidase [Gemmatimonadaceae bacterium]
MRLRILSAALALGAAACAQPPLEPAPAPVRDTAARVPGPDDVPPFRATPLVAAWGPLPPGTLHAERARTYDLQHQVVRLRFDWKRHAVVGSTTMRLAPLDSAITSVEIDAVGMKFSSVRVAGGAKLKYDYDDSSLAIKLPRPLRPKRSLTLEIAYEAVTPKKGAYFVDRKHVLWTQGETEDTRYWVPTFDYPSDKTTWEFYITVPKSERALSNGKLAKVRDLPCRKPRKGDDKSATECEAEYHWSQAKPASTYLMTAVTGAFTVIEDTWEKVPVGYWTYPDSVDAAKRGFGKTPRMIELFSRRTGVDYPWDKYDQVVAPDYIFGGMENVSATTQSDDDILHPAWAERERNAEALVAHELGHQWYGDLLTARGWGDIWLNEGFATFMEQTWTEFGITADEGAYNRMDAHEQVVAADRAARRPIVYNTWETNPLELFFSGHIYPKGAAILQMLRHQLGDSTFWAAMRRYTTEHAYGSVVSADLERAFEEETKRDFKPFFHDWVYHAGFPTYRVSYAYDSTAKRLTVDAQETQPHDSLTGSFDANVDVEVLIAGGVRRGVVPMRGGNGTVVMPLPSAPRSIRWNKGQWLLELHDFPRSTAMLAYQLAHDDDVGGRIEAARLLAERKGEALARRALDTAATSDRFWAVRVEAIRAIAAVAKDTLARNTLLDASADPDPRVRRAAVIALRGHPGTFTVTRLRVMAIADAPLDVRAAALGAYAALDPAVAMPEIRNALNRDSWLDILRAGALAALRGVDAQAAWEVLPRYVNGLNSRAAREAAIASLLALKKGREAQLATLLESQLSDADLFIRIDLANTLAELGQPSSVLALAARRKAEPESRVINAIDAALGALKKQ